MLKAAFLKACFETLYYSGASAVLAPALRGRGVIFCLHHVTPGGGKQTGFAPNSNLEMTPEFLADVITLAREKGYETLSLTAACLRLQNTRQEMERPFAVFTLDDGYVDNLIHAMPVFQRLSCPFTVFVSPRIIEGTCELWWRGLEYVIATCPKTLRLDFNGETISMPVATEAEKWTAWKSLAPKVQELAEYAQRDWIKRTAEAYKVDLNGVCRSAAMTWDQLRSMNADPLATIGAHTLNHYRVSRLSEEDARRELVESGAQLASELATAIEHFAYPYGNVAHAGPRDFKLAEEAGYLSAVTTRPGVVFDEHASHLHALPRMILSGRYQKRRYVQTLMSGATGALANRFRKVNVG